MARSCPGFRTVVEIRCSPLFQTCSTQRFSTLGQVIGRFTAATRERGGSDMGGSYADFVSITISCILITISWIDPASQTPVDITTVHCASNVACCQDAGEVKSENKELFAYINGKSFPAGIWTLQVSDDLSGPAEKLEYFSLILECLSPTPAPTIPDQTIESTEENEVQARFDGVKVEFVGFEEMKLEE